MIKEFGGKRPQIADSAYVDDASTVIGEVEVGERSSIWPGAVIRGDGGPIKIGKKTSIQENAVVHANLGSHVTIGNECIIGHGAIVHCKEVGDRVLVGMNSVLLRGAKVEDESAIAADSLVGEEMKIEKRSFFAGSPGEVKKKVTDGQVQRIALSAAYYANLSEKYKELQGAKD